MKGHSPEVIWLTDPLSNENLMQSEGKNCGLAQCKEEQMIGFLKEAIVNREMRELPMVIIISSQNIERLEYLIHKLNWGDLETVIGPSLNPFRGYSMIDMDSNERSFWSILRL